MDESLRCPVCTENIEYAAIGDCDHALCHICNLRLRALYLNTNCALCKADQKSVVYQKVDSASSSIKQFSYFDRKKLKALKRLKIYCANDDIYEEVQILLRSNCPDPDCDVSFQSGWRELKQHIRQIHKKFICDICIKHKKAFSHEHSLFTKSQLERHCKSGDASDPSFKGHPKCEFCHTFFYSVDEIFEHCREKHETCHLCTRRGVHNQYYKDYYDLERHFGKDHFLCKQPSCLEKKFIVFESEIEFKRHMTEEHSSSLDKYQLKQTRKVDLNFEYSSASGSRSSHKAKEPKKRFNIPKEFGTELTEGSARTLNLESSRVNTSQESSTDASKEPMVEDWPTLGEPSRKRTVQHVPESEKRLFDKISDEKLLKLLKQAGVTAEMERKVSNTILRELGNDAKQWKMFKFNCVNYLKGLILPEKLFDQLETRLGLATGVRLFPSVIHCFPEGKQTALLRVLNDKKVRLRDETMDDPTKYAADRRWAAGQGASRSKILVVKNHSNINASRFQRLQPHEKESASYQYLNTKTKALTMNEFPELPSSSSAPSNSSFLGHPESFTVKKAVKSKSKKSMANQISSTQSNLPVETKNYSQTSTPSNLYVQSLSHGPKAMKSKLNSSAEFPALPTVEKSKLQPWMSRGNNISTKKKSSQPAHNSWQKKDSKKDSDPSKKNKNVVLRFG